MLSQLPADECHDVANDVAEIHGILPRLRLGRELANPLDDVRRAVAVRDGRLEGLADQVERRIRGRQPVSTRICVGDDRRERLVHLVGDGRGELPERRHAAHVGELSLDALQGLRGALPLGEVDDERDVPRRRVSNNARRRESEVSAGIRDVEGGPSSSRPSRTCWAQGETCVDHEPEPHLPCEREAVVDRGFHLGERMPSGGTTTLWSSLTTDDFPMSE